MNRERMQFHLWKGRARSWNRQIPGFLTATQGLSRLPALPTLSLNLRAQARQPLPNSRNVLVFAGRGQSVCRPESILVVMNAPFYF